MNKNQYLFSGKIKDTAVYMPLHTVALYANISSKQYRRNMEGYDYHEKADSEL